MDCFVIENVGAINKLIKYTYWHGFEHLPTQSAICSPYIAAMWGLTRKFNTLPNRRTLTIIPNTKASLSLNHTASTRS